MTDITATVEKVATNSLLTAFARIMVTLGTPSLIGLMTFILTDIWALDGRVAGIEATIKSRIETAALREAIQDARIAALEARGSQSWR